MAAVACLDTWHTELGVVPMVEQEFFTNALATENPNLRAEVREGRGRGGRGGGGGEEVEGGVGERDGERWGERGEREGGGGRKEMREGERGGRWGEERR